MTSPSDSDALQKCLDVLRDLQRNPHRCSVGNSHEHQIAGEAAKLLRSLKAAQKAEQKKRDRELQESTGIRQERERRRQSVSNTTEVPRIESSMQDTNRPILSATRRCYICKQPYAQVHHFYDMMCPACGDQNFAKRSQSADLSEYTSLVTGGRIKIGFQISLKLLRAGSRVMITTRFPHDAALRFSREADFSDWSDRIHIFAADFRYLPGVQALANDITNATDRLDILINNAAQTVRRPPAFYRHLLEGEAKTAAALPPAAQKLLGSQSSLLPDGREVSISEDSQLHPAAAMTQLPLLPEDDQPNTNEFPLGQLDADGQQIDKRGFNSWVQNLADVSLGELVEVHAVNCLSPYILIGCLEPLMVAPPNRNRFIVNVSAMEGKFHAVKTGFHPHTNMAKAAMNMITRTCADRFAERHIYMNSVDTGWITNEFPFAKTAEMAGDGFEPDEIDGASRVCDPVFSGIASKPPIYGEFLKDYRSVSW